MTSSRSTSLTATATPPSALAPVRPTRPPTVRAGGSSGSTQAGMIATGAASAIANLPRIDAKIALVSRSGSGGVARHILDLLALQTQGVARFHGVFTVLSESFRRRLLPFREQGFTWDELPMRRSPHPWHDIAALHRMMEYLAAARVDLVHTHGTKGGYLGRLAARRLGLPAIHTPHTFPMEIHTLQRTLIKPALIGIERTLARITDAQVVLTESQRQLAERWNIAVRREVLIPNAIGAPYSPEWVSEERARQRTRLGLPADAPVAVWTGRFDPQKNPELVLLAGVRWLTACPTARLVLVGAGDGPVASDSRGEGGHRMAAMATQFARAGLATRVVFTGECDNVEEILCAGDLFLNASHYEGMPYVVLEAMRVGLPLVLTDIAGHRDMISTGEEGFLCPLDSSTLSAAMQRLTADSALRARMGLASRRRGGRYPMEAFLKAHAALYRSVATRAGR
ncbi:MAG TPA: glycosyltransferase [Planctomycetota bacterium]|nr:glycosyltransferase [Planctomycetota bacterium]